MLTEIQRILLFEKKRFSSFRLDLSLLLSAHALFYIHTSLLNNSHIKDDDMFENGNICAGDVVLSCGLSVMYGNKYNMYTLYA